MSIYHRQAHAEHGNTFGNDAFGQFAERAAKFFGTPQYIIGQTVIVFIWIILNTTAIFAWHWDPYPLILLNLVFSTQAAYAAPLILLASTRQTARDKAFSEADTKHREEVAKQQAELLQQNTALTQAVHDLTVQLYAHVVATNRAMGIDTPPPGVPQ